MGVRVLREQVHFIRESCHSLHHKEALQQGGDDRLHTKATPQLTDPIKGVRR